MSTEHPSKTYTETSKRRRKSAAVREDDDDDDDDSFDSIEYESEIITTKELQDLQTELKTPTYKEYHKKVAEMGLELEASAARIAELTLEKIGIDPRKIGIDP